MHDIKFTKGKAQIWFSVFQLLTRRGKPNQFCDPYCLHEINAKQFGKKTQLYLSTREPDNFDKEDNFEKHFTWTLYQAHGLKKGGGNFLAVNLEEN